MSPERDSIAALRALWAADPGRHDETDYALLAEIEGSYAARSRAGLPALVLPLKEAAPATAGRRAAGCEIVAHPSTRFIFDGRETVGPAAALLCTDPELVDSFAVLASDIAKRGAGGNWSSIMAAVEEWQMLLTPRGHPSAEAEEGLWGELWFVVQAEDIDRAIAAWRGPDGDAADFFLQGKSAEVKTSRQRRQHHLSQSQVVMPVGTGEAWLLSVWVKLDPGTSITVAQLAKQVLDRASDRGEALRRLLRAGYSPLNRTEYTAAFAVLAEPEWYAAGNVPQVRAADQGVSHLRYRVSLDEDLSADQRVSASLWRHFHGHDYGGARQ